MFAILGFVTALATGFVAEPSAAASPCAGSLPAVGVVLHGPVLHVIDGRTLCVAEGADPASWIAVRLDDVPDATAWGALMAAAFTQTVDCLVSTADGGGPAVARCAIQGRPLGEIVHDTSVQAAAPAWRRHAPPQGSQGAARLAATLPR